MMFKVLLATLVAVLAAGSAGARTGQIHTAGESGAYQNDFCPGLKKALEAAKLTYDCAASSGSVENITRVLERPEDIGFAQFDIFAREAPKFGGEPLTVIRNDFGRECLFMVTSNKHIKTFGEVSALAEHLSFVLPPEGSGSAATFEFLQKIDPEGLGKARKIAYAASTDEAIARALAGPDDQITLFVQFPDPNNPRFKAIDEASGQFIPVIDRAILRQEVNGQKVYYAQETEISNPKFLKKGETVITSCTPLTIFTGSAERIADPVARANHQDMILTIRDLDRAVLLPKEGFFASLWKRTKELSASAIEAAVALSEQSRAEARPLIEKARQKVQDSEPTPDGGQVIKVTPQAKPAPDKDGKQQTGKDKSQPPAEKQSGKH